MHNTLRNFRRLVWFAGAFNMAMAAPLLLPEIYAHYFSLLWKINLALGLGGAMPIAPTEGVQALMINTAGIDLVLIGAIVFSCGFDPANRRFILLANATGRLLFATIIVYYAVAYDIMQLILFIGGIDVAVSLGFIYFLHKLRKAPQ